MKRKFLLSTLLISVMLTACSQEKADYVAPSFEKDAGTVTKEESIKFKSIYEEPTSEEEIDELPKEPVYGYMSLGEITITGEDNTQDYTIEGTDVIYNGVTYKGLLQPLDYIELPSNISKSTFINFIIKVLRPDTTEVIVNFGSDNKPSDEEDYSISYADSFFGENEYNILKSKYGKDVTWDIDLFDQKNVSEIQIFGCDKYMFIARSSDIEVDMSAYSHTESTADLENITTDEDTETVDETTETTTEEDIDSEENESDSEEIEEDTQENNEETTEIMEETQGDE